ncbi:MAG: choice-of-anchor tandem repeat GloVer-containing protein [Terriglobales bacterium]
MKPSTQGSLTHAFISLLCAMTLAMFVAPGASGQTFSVLYTFTGGNDGAFPGVTPTLDAAGNLYGGTVENASSTCKAFCSNIFKLSPAGQETTLFTSKGGVQGFGPSTLIVNKSGTIYGTMQYGGKDIAGYVFKLSKKDKITMLHQFPASSGDGQLPAFLILDPAGNMHGLAVQGGGTGCDGLGCGIIFELAKKKFQESIIDFTDGIWLPDSLLLDAKGNLYGTSYFGGGAGCGGTGCGTVFKIDTTGNITILYRFQGVPDASLPEGQIALDSEGNVYGTTWEGGNGSICQPSGCGTIYKIDPSGKETVLHEFSYNDGALPEGGVLLDSSGNLYGTAYAGGNHGFGTVFKIDAGGNFTTIYNFTNGADGAEPDTGLVRDADGNLYGGALFGGYSGGNGLCFPGGCGTIFKITP